MSLSIKITDVVTRIATECKAIYSKLAGNTTGDLSTLNTTAKSSLLAAINEVNSAQATRLLAAEKGAPNGVASLDGGGKVPSVQLPGFVDDVLEFANLASFPVSGSGGILYVAQDSNRTYRWSGSGYVQIGSSGAVDSVFGRTGNVIAAVGDYDASEVNNDSSVSGASVAAALNTLKGVTDNAVRFDAQTLTAPQKTQAQTNIDAASATDVGDTARNFVADFNTGLV
jgi:hypothetical protein